MKPSISHKLSHLDATVFSSINEMYASRDLSNDLSVAHQDVLDNTFGKLKLLNPALENSKYFFKPDSKDHYFVITSDSNITDFMASARFINCETSKISYNLHVLKHCVVLWINWNLSPVKPKWNILGKKELIFNGGYILNHHFEQTKVERTKHLYVLPHSSIKQSIDHTINVLEADIKLYWSKGIQTPAEAKHLSITMVSYLMSLMSMVSVNLGVTKFKPLPIMPDMMIEGLDSWLVQRRSDQESIVGVLLYIMGVMLTRHIVPSYTHLLKGYNAK